MDIEEYDKYVLDVKNTIISNMIANAHYSHSQLKNKSITKMHELLKEKCLYWNDWPNYIKKGRTVVKIKTEEFVDNEYISENVKRTKWVVDNNIPEFKENRNYIINRMKQDCSINL